jgi:hypothetical protein
VTFFFPVGEFFTAQLARNISSCLTLQRYNTDIAVYECRGKKFANIFIMPVKVVKVKMVIFISGLCHLLTIYKYKIFIIVAVLTLFEIDFDK